MIEDPPLDYNEFISLKEVSRDLLDSLNIKPLDAFETTYCKLRKLDYLASDSFKLSKWVEKSDRFPRLIISSFYYCLKKPYPKFIYDCLSKSQNFKISHTVTFKRLKNDPRMD